jgi:myo-inositol-1(or 4)-monophosphatase
MNMELPFNSEQLEEYRKGTERIVEYVSGFIRDSFGNVREEHAEEKSKNSLVSEVDRKAEDLLVSRLRQLIPAAGFITEEETIAQIAGELYWVIDPLDGTTNFLYGVPAISVSVCLKYRGKAIIGVVSDIMQNATYSAQAGGGAFKNQSPIHVSTRQNIETALVATGFPYQSGSELDAHLKIVGEFVKKSRGVRRLGSAAIDLAYVAEGIFDIYFEFHLNEWDTAAGMLLVREAGGICSDRLGNRNYEMGTEIIAGNKLIYDSAFELISGILNNK